MPSNLQQILALEVPIVVRVAERRIRVEELMSWVPGAIIELPKNADAELDLMVNNCAIGQGLAVKVGENFGIRITYIGDIAQRVAAMSAEAQAASAADAEAEALAAQMLAGQ